MADWRNDQDFKNAIVGWPETPGLSRLLGITALAVKRDALDQAAEQIKALPNQGAGYFDPRSAVAALRLDVLAVLKELRGEGVPVTGDNRRSSQDKESVEPPLSPAAQEAMAEIDAAERDLDDWSRNLTDTGARCYYCAGPLPPSGIGYEERDGTFRAFCSQECVERLVIFGMKEDP